VCLGPCDSVGFASVVKWTQCPGEQAHVRRQVCHLSEVIVAKELMGGDRSCQMWGGLGWECLGW
jgi:hypothetical protein